MLYRIILAFPFIVISVASIWHMVIRIPHARAFRSLSDRDSCGPIKWFRDGSWLPFGISSVLELGRADTARRLPVAFVEGHIKHGDTYWQRMFGSFMLLTRDPRNIKVILQNTDIFEVGTLRRKIFWPLLGAGIFTNDGPSWKRSRRLLTPIFKKPETLEMSRIEQHVQNLLKALRGIKKSGSPTNVQQPVMTAWHSISTEFLLGQPSNEDGVIFMQALSDVLQYMGQRARLSALYFLKNSLSFWSNVRIVNSTLDNLITSAKSNPDSNTSIALNHVINNTPNNTVARWELLNLLFAARDTSAATTDWIIYSLAHSPTSFTKLKAEVESVLFDKRAPTSKDLCQLTYLDNFIAEVMRLFPPIFISGRMCAADTTLPRGGGDAGDQSIVVPAGTFVLYPILGLHRNPAIYGADAGEFRPERWDEVSTKERSLNWEYIPFNGGPRKCIGEQLAWKQLKYLTSRLVQSIKSIGVKEEKGEAQRSANWVDNVEYCVVVGMTPFDGPQVLIEFEDEE